MYEETTLITKSLNSAAKMNVNTWQKRSLKMSVVFTKIFTDMNTFSRISITSHHTG